MPALIIAIAALILSALNGVIMLTLINRMNKLSKTSSMLNNRTRNLVRY
jgi:hypothetical protein